MQLTIKFYIIFTFSKSLFSYLSYVYNFLPSDISILLSLIYSLSKRFSGATILSLIYCASFFYSLALLYISL